jgi:hypothetical protein
MFGALFCLFEYTCGLADDLPLEAVDGKFPFLIKFLQVYCKSCYLSFLKACRLLITTGVDYLL